MTTTTANPNVLNALTDTFEFLTTMALFGMVMTHFLLNTSLITLFHRLKERHESLERYILIYYSTTWFLLSRPES